MHLPNNCYLEMYLSWQLDLANLLLVDAFGLRGPIPEHLRLIFAARRTHLPDINGDDSWTLPIPARCVVGTDGTVSYSGINPGHRIRPEPHDLYPTLKRLNRDADPAK
jgi:hypothetical protein